MRSHGSGNPSLGSRGVTGLKSYAMLSVVTGAILLLLSCGKKGPPTLTYHAEAATPAVSKPMHHEDTIRLTWPFPMKDEADIRGVHQERGAASDTKRIALAVSDVRWEGGATKRTDLRFNPLP